jgi:hypothetical protein
VNIIGSGLPPRVPCGSPIPWLSSDIFHPHTLLKSIDIDVGWPTSLIGGERPGGSEFGSG